MKHRRRQRGRPSAPQTCGFTLSELLVAMALSAALLAGAVHVYVISAQANRTLEAIATLEEQLTFALQALSADLRNAGYTRPEPAPPLTATCQGNDASAWATAAPAITAADGSYDLPCPPFGSHVADTDTLSVRMHAPDTDEIVHAAHGWYIDRRSSATGQPSLRRLTLLPDGSMQVQEIIPGIEDLQLSFVADTDDDGSADSISTAAARALAVIVTLRVRAAVREPGYGTDGYRRRTATRLIALRNPQRDPA